MSYIEYELRRNQVFVAGRSDNAAIDSSLLRSTHGLAADPLQPLFFDDKWQWVLFGPWQKTGDDYQLDCADQPGMRISKPSGSSSVHVLTAGLASGDALSLVYAPQPGEREWTQVPLEPPYSYLVEASEIGSENDSVSYLLMLRGGWLLRIVVTELAEAKPLVESSLVPSDQPPSSPIRHRVRCSVETMITDVRACLWPNPHDVGERWRVFSLWSNEPKLCSAVYVTANGTVRREQQARATAGPSTITSRTLSWGDGERATMMVELGQETKLVYLLAQPLDVQRDVEYDVYIDLGTTTTYLVYCRADAASTALRRVEALDCDISKASVLFMNDPQRSLNALWIPEGVRPPPEFGVTTVLRTALLTRARAGATFRPFEDQFLATPAALQHSLGQSDIELHDRKLKWSFADGNENNKEHFRQFVLLLLLWTASRLMHEERGLAGIRLHLSHPRKMAGADEYTQSVEQAMAYARETTGLELTHTHGTSWPDEGLLPYFAAKAWIRESDGLKGNKLVKLLVADLGGGTLDLAGYLLRERETRVLFSRSLRVGADECFSDPFRGHVKAQGNSDLPKRWFLEVASPKDPLARRLDQPTFDPVATSVLGHYREFLAWALKICALALHHDAEWVLRGSALRIDIGTPDPPLDASRNEYLHAPIIVFLSGGGWKWFRDPEKLLGDNLVPPTVRTLVYFCEKKAALVGAARQHRGAEAGGGGDSLDGFPRGCLFGADAGPLEFVRVANDTTIYELIVGRNGSTEAQDLASARGATDHPRKDFAPIRQDPFVQNIVRNGFNNRILWRGGGAAHENTVDIEHFGREEHNASWLLYCLETIGKRFLDGGT